MPEGFEIVAFDISHQKFDSQNGNHKCHYHSYKQDDHLCGGKLKTKFHNFQKAGSKHNWYPQEKCKLSSYSPGSPQKNPTNNGRS